jgi:hypothetical protein
LNWLPLDWFSHQRLLEPTDQVPPAEVEAKQNRQQLPLAQVA